MTPRSAAGETHSPLTVRWPLVVLTSAWLASPRECAAQTVTDALSTPTSAELSALRATVDDRDRDRLRALRQRRRWFIEAGAALLDEASTRDGDAVVTRGPSLNALVAMGLRFGVGDLVELHARVEIAGPMPITRLPDALSAMAAAQRCDGSRSFELPPGLGGIFTAELGARLRLLSLRSPFYVGVGVRAGLQVGAGTGTGLVRCVGRDGVERSRVSMELDEGASIPLLGGQLETGFRFGDREEFDLSLRMLASLVNVESPGPSGAQLSFSWYFW